jgi:hypothetical protein
MRLAFDVCIAAVVCGQSTGVISGSVEDPPELWRRSGRVSAI